jgi:hypothetical protein
MSLTDRERRIVSHAADVISRESSAEGDVAANLHALRRVMHRNKLTLGELFGLAGHDQAVEELTRERDQWRRAYERSQRQAARQTEPAREARTAKADAFAAEVAKVIKVIMRAHRGISMDGIAAELEQRKIRTASGSVNWTRMQVLRVMRRVGM